MSTTHKISTDEEGKSIDEHEYRSMIEGLLYPIASHLDIAYNDGCVPDTKLVPENHTRKWRSKY